MSYFHLGVHISDAFELNDGNISDLKLFMIVLILKFRIKIGAFEFLIRLKFHNIDHNLTAFDVFLFFKKPFLFQKKLDEFFVFTRLEETEHISD